MNDNEFKLKALGHLIAIILMAFLVMLAVVDERNEMEKFKLLHPVPAVKQTPAENL